MTASTASWSGVRMSRHNGQRGRLENSEVSDITLSTTGWSGVRMVWYNGQHGPLEGSENCPAQVSAWSVGVK